MLDVPRSHIEAYCQEAGLEPVCDPSNRDLAHLRNRLRWELIPILEREFNPRLKDALAHLARTLRDEEEWLRPLVEEAFCRCARVEAGRVVLDITTLVSYPQALRRRIVRRAAALVGGGPAPFPAFEHVEACLALPGMAVGKRLELPGGLLAWRDYGSLVFTRQGAVPADRPFLYRLEVPGSVVVPEAGVRLEADVSDRPVPADGRSVAVMDADLVGGALVVRNRRPGDRFYPLGLGAPKKLKEYFINEKVPRGERDSIPLVAIPGGDGDADTIIWVVGHRPDDRFRPTATTRRYLVLRTFVFKMGVC